MSRLTSRQVETAGPGRYSDGNNLSLLVTARGGRSWVFRYARDGKSHDVGIGSAADVALADARIEAARLRGVLREGGDPKATREKERRRRAPSAKPTMREFAEKRIEAWQGDWKNEKHRQQWTNTLATYAWPVIGELAVDQVTVADVVAVVEPIWTTKAETATRVLNRLSRLFRAARALGLRDDDPADWRRVADILSKRKRRRERVRHHPAVPYQEVPALVAKLRRLSSVSASALEFLILCASRTGEVVGARWDELDAEQRTWTIPADRMKMDEEHIVPLSDCAVSIVRGMPRDSALIFHGRTGEHLSTMALLQCVRGVAPGYTVHGFRSSFTDWSHEQTDAKREVVEKCLAHAIASETEAAYRRGELLEKRRELLSAWADYCGLATA